MSKGKKKRKDRQRKRRLFQMVREDLQLSGDLPTTPEGGLRPEVVPPDTQQEGGAAELPKLVKQAIREGWATPNDARIRHVDELSAIIDDPDQQAKVKIAAFNALRLADKDQWERDNPETAGRAKGGQFILNLKLETVVASDGDGQDGESPPEAAAVPAE